MAHLNPSSVQSAVDRRLRDELLTHPDIQRALRQVDESASVPGTLSRRRRLLANAFRLTRSTAPALMEALAVSQELMGHEAPVEVFVHPESMIRAAVVQGPPETPAIVLSSRLLDVFTDAELRFVLGRALGHLSLGHFAIPVLSSVMARENVRGAIPRAVALKLYPLSQAAKASADRAGALCAREIEAAASALFKLASGLSSAPVKAELQLRTREVDSLLAGGASRETPRGEEDTLGCFITHPFSPPRLRALVAFSRTRTFRLSAGLYASEEGLLDEEADALLTRDLRELEPTYLEESPRAELLSRVLEMGDRVGVAPPRSEDAGNDWESVLSRVAREATLAERARLVQHLTWGTATNGNVTDERFLGLLRTAEALSVPVWLVDEALRSAAHPLD